MCVPNRILFIVFINLLCRTEKKIPSTWIVLLHVEDLFPREPLVDKHLVPLLDPADGLWTLDPHHTVPYLAALKGKPLSQSPPPPWTHSASQTIIAQN